MKTKINAEAVISATIIRADGTKEELGVVSRENLGQKAVQKIKELLNGNSINNSR
jgi:hypothetical protein